MTEVYHWWQTGIIYQIYPRSFQDANNDGIGDLIGIIRRLDYLQQMQVDAIWLSPIYPSPMHDFGYDVADYTGVNALFGTMDDFDHLLAGAHQRGLKVILDLVPNHTSDEHPWFVESRQDRDNPKRNWYIWRDPAPDGGPPNNWLSFFGGPAWTYDKYTDQYYLHQFLKQQPELNYRHPEVLPAMLDVMRFWLDKGVDGFRLDAIWLLVKDEQFRDEPPDPAWSGGDPHKKLQHIYTQDVLGMHDILRQMRGVVDDYDDRVLIGETNLPVNCLTTYYDRLITYYGQDDEIHLPYNFQLIELPWQAPVIREAVRQYEAALPVGAWPNWVLGNHDRPRVTTRAGRSQTRVAAMLLLTLRGTPTLYYGEEIGMEDVPIPLDMVQDPPAINQPELADIIGRDPVRTPMQWDTTTNAGFTDAGVIPWLPLATNYRQCNVADQETDSTSQLSFYRVLIALRRRELALNVGAYTQVDAGADEVIAYVRSAPNADRFLIVLNLSACVHVLNLSIVAPVAEIALATDMMRTGMLDLASLTLRADEGLLLRLPV